MRLAYVECEILRNLGGLPVGRLVRVFSQNNQNIDILFSVEQILQYILHYMLCMYYYFVHELTLMLCMYYYFVHELTLTELHRFD
jgi:hypothetical protein